MIVLGIDTSGPAASAAVLVGDHAGAAAADVPRAHAAVLPGLIKQAAHSAGQQLDAITHVAVARGPGLFTGMRVGLVTAEMFALARGLPLAGVSTLHGLAHRVVQQHAPASAFAVCVDARRREAFVQVFDPAGAPMDEPRALGATALRGPAGIPADIPDDAIFMDTATAPLGLPGVPLRTDRLAVEIARLAAERWRSGAPSEPATPIYLRRPDTTRANPARSVLGHP